MGAQTIVINGQCTGKKQFCPPCVTVKKQGRADFGNMVGFDHVTLQRRPCSRVVVSQILLCLSIFSLRRHMLWCRVYNTTKGICSGLIVTRTEQVVGLKESVKLIDQVCRFNHATHAGVKSGLIFRNV